MAFEALSEKPLRVEKMSVLDGIVWAFAPEYEHLMLALGGFEWINNIDKCNGVLLNRIGQLVCLTRQQAGAMIGSRELADNDDIYRVCLKYKAYVNSCRCTPNEIIEATKIIFGATELYTVSVAMRLRPFTFRFPRRSRIWFCPFWERTTWWFIRRA